jgi:hypothetical protein
MIDGWLWPRFWEGSADSSFFRRENRDVSCFALNGRNFHRFNAGEIKDSRERILCNGGEIFQRREKESEETARLGDEAHPGQPGAGTKEEARRMVTGRAKEKSVRRRNRREDG